MYIVADEYISFILVKWWETSFVFIFHVVGRCLQHQNGKIYKNSFTLSRMYFILEILFLYPKPLFLSPKCLPISHLKIIIFILNFQHFSALSRKGLSINIPLDFHLYIFFLFDSILPYSVPDASYYKGVIR